MTEPLALLIQGFIREMRALVAAFSYLGRDEWEAQSRRQIIRFHGAAYFLGQGSDVLSGRGDIELGALMQAQYTALAGFGDALEAGTISEAQAQARATLYGGALKATHSRGEFGLWEIPVHPGEGSPCRGNCRCDVVVRVLNLEELDADIDWTLGEAEHCAVCIRRAAGSPYPVRGGVWTKELR